MYFQERGLTVIGINEKCAKSMSKMALPKMALPNLRGPPCLELNPGTHDLRYKLPIRNLNGRELMKISNELDFVERFT